MDNENLIKIIKEISNIVKGRKDSGQSLYFHGDYENESVEEYRLKEIQRVLKNSGF